LKYIVFGKPETVLPLAVSFNGPMTHLQMAQIMEPAGYRPRSAGFISASGETYGASASLSLKSRYEDAALIRRMSESTLAGVPGPQPVGGHQG
jgi:hypothetical protein